MRFIVGVLIILSQTLYFDFGDGTTGEEGWTPVTGSMIYNSTIGYGWTDILRAETRPTLEGIYEGLVWSGEDSTFYVDLPNGNYRVIVYYGDIYPHAMSVYAEGEFVANLTSYEDKLTAHMFLVTVEDGQLALRFDDTDNGLKWTLSALEIEGLPPEEPTPNATETMTRTETEIETETETLVETTIRTINGTATEVIMTQTIGYTKVFGVSAYSLVAILVLLVVILGAALFKVGETREG